MSKKDFVKYDENSAGKFDGTAADGEIMQLGNDILLYWRLVGFEQPVIDRISRSSETLATELNDFAGSPGLLFLGNPEDIREELHISLDKMFAAIYKYRKLITEEEAQKVFSDEQELDDIIYKEEEKENAKE